MPSAFALAMLFTSVWLQRIFARQGQAVRVQGLCRLRRPSALREKQQQRQQQTVAA